MHKGVRPIEGGRGDPVGEGIVIRVKKVKFWIMGLKFLHRFQTPFHLDAGRTVYQKAVAILENARIPLQNPNLQLFKNKLDPMFRGLLFFSYHYQNLKTKQSLFDFHKYLPIAIQHEKWEF